MPGYIRFVVGKLDPDSHQPLGVFQALAELREARLLSEHEEALLAEIEDWFSENLEKPRRFSTSKGRTYGAQNRGISWFKDSAKQHVAKIRELVAILKHHDVHVHMLRTDRPGYVVYEDEFQIVAEPFVDVTF